MKKNNVTPKSAWNKTVGAKVRGNYKNDSDRSHTVDSSDVLFHHRLRTTSA